MSKTQAAVTYLADRRHFETISALMYLVDWKSCLVRGEQLTDLRWVRRYGQPMSDMPTAWQRSLLQSIFGRPKNAFAALNDVDLQVLNYVLDVTEGLSRWELTRLVLSTHPCFSQEPGSTPFNMPALAVDYRETPHGGAAAQRMAA